jgi:Leucine-rich repeat (LRR) protein
LPPLAALTALRILGLSQTAVSDLAPLAALTALRTLILDQTAVSDLASLATLTALQRLTLDRTAVSDLASLAGLTDLKHLALNGCQVADLRPIRGCAKLGTNGPPGLRFPDTPATKVDGTLARLAGIEDAKDRSRETLAYLNTLPPWPEPYTPSERQDGEPPQPIGKTPEAPKQDPALPLIWGDAGFAFLAARVDSDPVTEAALDDLRVLLEDLRRKGNRHDDLYRLAGEMQDRSAGPIAGLNMVRLHLSYQKLRRVYLGRSSRSERLDDETETVIASVLEILPGVTLADPGVKVLIDRQDAERAAVATADKAAAEAAFLDAMQGDDAPFAPEVKEAAQAIAVPGIDDRLSASRSILSQNGLIAVMHGIVGGVISAPITGPVGNFVYEHRAEILNLARTMGDDAFFWAQMVFASFKAEYEIVMGIAREAVGSGFVRRGRHKDKS